MSGIVTFPTPVPVLQFLDDTGLIVPGGKLFTYDAGTTTKLATYTDATGATPNTNPIVADADGRLTCFLSPGVAYKLVWAPADDTDPPTNPFWTQDGIITTSASSQVINNNTNFLHNLYWDGVNYRYLAAGVGSVLALDSDGALTYQTAPSGSAGSIATLTTVFGADITGKGSFGTTLAPWGANEYAIDLGPRAAIGSLGTEAMVLENLYYDGSDFRYKETGAAAYLSLEAGALVLYTAPSGATGTVATMTARATFNNAGPVVIPGTATLGAVSATNVTVSTLAATSVTISTPLPIASGGTGASSASGARTNLGASRLGVGQVWAGAGLVLGTTYQNTSGNPIMISAVTAHASNSAVTAAYCDATDGLTVLVGQGGAAAGIFGVFNFIVPNNSYYTVKGVSDVGNCSMLSSAVLQ